MNLVISTLTIVFVLTLAFAIPASAEIIPLTVSMDGAQANAGAGTGSAGTGSASLTFDTVTKNLTWSIAWSGLTGTPSLMHFHGPALPNQNAPVLVDTGVVGPPVVGNATLSAGLESDLLAGLWYLNLHTTTFTAGEIRGQVGAATPVPSVGPLAMVGLVGLVAGVALRRIRIFR